MGTLVVQVEVVLRRVVTLVALQLQLVRCVPATYSSDSDIPGQDSAQCSVLSKPITEQYGGSSRGLTGATRNTHTLLSATQATWAVGAPRAPSKMRVIQLSMSSRVDAAVVSGT